jgi:hypothetical protein
MATNHHDHTSRTELPEIEALDQVEALADSIESKYGFENATPCGEYINRVNSGSAVGPDTTCVARFTAHESWNQKAAYLLLFWTDSDGAFYRISNSPVSTDVSRSTSRKHVQSLSAVVEEAAAEVVDP